MKNFVDSNDCFYSASQVNDTDDVDKPSDEDLNQLLSAFEGYGLADLDQANLMSRVDSKFILPMSLLPTLLPQLSCYYRVLDINGIRISTYFNQYFDTQEMRFYQDHHNGKLNRYKVRHRTYVDTNTRFLEVKFKNNQKRTVKSRIRLQQPVTTTMDEQAFIDQQMSMSLKQLMVSQQGGYQRIALANEATSERLTLDYGLWYQVANKEEIMCLPGFFIAELKQKKHSKLSPFYQLMSANHIVARSFSKYCIGCAMLYGQELKSNLFKATISQVESYNRLYQSSSMSN